MRILHTADWHLGARFHDRRRGDDEEHALEQIVTLAREREVDAVLVAGDVFDTANPGGEEQRRYYRTLARLVDAGPEGAGVGTVVVTAGNHDGALRLDGPRDLLKTLRIHVVGRWPRDARAADCVVVLRDRRGTPRAVCAAVPYLRDGDLRLATPGESAGEVRARYADALKRRYAEAREAATVAADEIAPDLPLVVMGHCTVVGYALGGEERQVRIGTLDLVDAADLADDASYLALGHIHRPQAVGERAHWRYSGSLLPTGFDEAGTGREVVLVDLEGDHPAAIERVPLEPYRGYRRLRGTPEELRRRIDALDEADPGAPEPWCEATVVVDEPMPGIARELVDRADARGWALVSTRRELLRDILGQEPPPPLAGADLEALDPVEVFEQMHESEYGRPPDDDLRGEFLRLLEEIHASAEDLDHPADDGATAG